VSREVADLSIRLADSATLAANLRRQRDELRAVLAPLLDDPWRGVDWIPVDDRGAVDPMRACVFCGDGIAHLPDCPVLRRDALLGRS
jgi:hypothetical protein